jgi:hypothetical protein
VARKLKVTSVSPSADALGQLPTDVDRLPKSQAAILADDLKEIE